MMFSLKNVVSSPIFYNRGFVIKKVFTNFNFEKLYFSYQIVYLPIVTGLLRQNDFFI